MSGTRSHHDSAIGARPGSPCSDLRHEEAVLHAEVKRLVRALAPYGVLRHDALKREAGARNWREPRFERALAAAVEQGEIEALPLGFYCLPHHA
jgi:hypothetical protein